MKAKLLSLLSLIVLSTGIICAAKVQIDDLYYNLNDADLTAEVAAQDANLSNNYPELAQAIIPATVSYNNNDYSVTSIGLSAFEDCSSLTIVSIPSTVTSIGAVSFSNCSSLTVLTIPNSVISIGGAAFSNCSSLTSVNIPNSVTSIEGNAFQRCIGLTSITCEAESAPSLGGDVFEGVDKSIPLYVPSESITAYQAASGWSDFTNIKAIPSGGASGIIASGTCGAEGSNLTWELSDGGLLTISGTGAMASYDYDGCSGNVNNSPWYDYKESILSVVIENGVTNIGQGAFAQCSNVTSIDIPVSVTGISNDAFVNCSELTSAPIGEGVVTIEWNAYEMCTGITSVTIPASVQTIGSWAFVHCSQSWAGLCPESGGLGGDGGMPTGDAPKRAKKAGDCGDITVITSYATTPPTLGQDAFNGTDVNIPVYVPSGSVAAYQAADGWSAFTNIQSIDGGGEPYTGKVEIDGLYYNLDGSTLTAEVAQSDNNYEGLTEANIPATISYNNSAYSVTSIENHAFYNCSGMTSLILPSSVTNIGNYAFIGCKGLTSLTIPSSITSIGNGTFSACSGIVSVDIPNSVTSIGEFAFSHCSGLTSVIIPSSVTSIGNSAFADCSNLTSVTIPNGVVSIGTRTFSGCSGLTSISVESGNTVYDSRDNCNAIIETATNTLLFGCQNTIIPSSVISIGGDAFYGSSGLTSIDIPSSVISIGGVAFSGCNSLISVTIPGSVTSIGIEAFAECSGLTSITCEATSAPELGDDVFYLVDKSIPLYVPSESIEAYQTASGWSEFTNIQAIPEPYSGRVEIDGINYYLIGSTLTAEVTRSDNNYEGLTEANIPATVSYNNNEYSVTSIGDHAFSNCSGLTSLTISSGVTSVGMSAFYNCTALTSVDIPSSVTSIELGAFGGCTGLTSITIPSGVTSIGQGAFSNCSGLTSITIPSSVTNIGNQAFFACSGVTSMSVDAGNPKYDSRNNCNAIIETATNTLLFGCPSTIIPSSVTSIESSAFNRFSNLISIDIPSSITSIGSGSFAYCTGLTSITIPSSVTSIGRSAFAFCPGLTSMTVEAGNPVYDSRDNCNAIIITASDTLIAGCQNTVIPSSVTSIDVNAFGGCSSLLSIDIPSGVTCIGEYAFQECTGLTSVTIPSSITSFGASAFYNCIGLTSVTIENGITTTGWSAFYGCSSLTSIELPSSITSLADYSFSNCSGLTSITCRAMNAPELGYDIFANVDKSIPLYVPSESVEAYQTASGWSDFTNIKAIPSGGGEVQIAMAVAANQWTFICLPPLGDRQYTQDMFTYDGLTGVQWGTYNGAKRAAGQSGWETPETFNAQQGYIIYSTTAGTLRIDAYEDDIRQGETADSISTPLSAYDSDQPANTGWNILGNPYNQGFPISALAAAGIESPITVWNGTGYTTYTPGIDDYTLQPLEAFFIQKAEGGAERITFRREELERDVEGALSGYFTVGESTRVRFSQGNLQYQASTQTWRFAENQYDMIGNDNANISDSYSGWIDLFGFGTGDNPTKSISNYSDYSSFTDWGVNAISNGGNEANLWRTLTTDEWLYLFYSRTDAANLFGLGSVNGVSGLIILPDNWTTPQGASFTPSTTQGLVDTGIYFSNTNGDNFSHNTYTAAQWLVMEQSGAVFLPVTGYRWGTGMDYVGTTGYYWSTTPYNEGYGRSLYFNSNYFYPQGSNDRYLGLSVRLVR